MIISTTYKELSLINSSIIIKDKIILYIHYQSTNKFVDKISTCQFILEKWKFNQCNTILFLYNIISKNGKLSFIHRKIAHIIT